MKLNKYTWIFVGLIAAVYLGTLLWVRLTNPVYLQKNMYQTWENSYVMHPESDQSFVNTSKNNDHQKPIALSESQGYGMLITVRAAQKGWANQKDFDRFVNYWLAHRDYVGDKRQTETYLMSWRQYYNRHHQWVNDINSATDGDVYIAMALALAAKQWPKDATYYRSLAKNLSDDILAYEYNPQTKALTVGDWVTKDSKYWRLMRTSDVMPNMFMTLAKLTGDSRWQTVNDTMLDRLVDLSRLHHTGLVPDFAWITKNSAKPVKPNAISTKYDGDYSANACRVPMMLATSKNPKAHKVLKKMLRFFSHQQYITAGYSLNGKRLVKYQSASFSAPIFFAVSHHRGEGYDNLFDSQKYIFSKPLTKKNYYDATLTVMAALEGLN